MSGGSNPDNHYEHHEKCIPDLVGRGDLPRLSTSMDSQDPVAALQFIQFQHSCEKAVIMSTMLSSCAPSLAISGSVTRFKRCGHLSFRATRLLIALAAGIWLGLVGTGCTVKKVSGVTVGGGAGAIGVDQVRSYASFEAIDEPYELEGMFRVMITPAMKSKPPVREALARETAARLGCDAVVGLRHYKEVYSGWEKSSGLLARLGSATTTAMPERPRYIVCLPRVHVQIESTPATAKLADYLREDLGFYLAEKGYYTYPSELPGGEVAGWIREGGDLSVLSEPLGAMPDYALVCEVAGYDKHGVPVLLNWDSINITLTLLDLQTRTATWTVTEKGGTAVGAVLPGSGLVLTLLSTKDDRLREGVYSVVNRALKSLPGVPGYRKL
jgi:hypothetical protein